MTEMEALRIKMDELGMLPDCGYFRSSMDRFRLRSPFHWKYERHYMNLPDDLRDIVMQSETFDCDLYHMLCLILDLDAETALRICLS